MAFQPNDYLTGLNLDFEAMLDMSLLPEALHQHDLELFGNPSDFLLLECGQGQEAPAKPVVMVAPAPVETRVVAAEDKRKRNTQALARFRIKKKIKEQEMERKLKELEEKVAALEKRLKQLEMENKCLKTMIVQRNDQKNDNLLEEIKRRSILDLKPMFTFTS